jgi:hypothetical protein
LAALHTFDWQSAFTRHALVAAQGAQLPPQLRSVSSPLVEVSLQVLGAQWLAAHSPEVQSAATWQALVSAHFAQPVPPQSTSVSVPFFTRSAQLGAWQVPPAQTPLGQSLPARHPTQVPAPSHMIPPFEVQAEPAVLGCWPGVPATHVPVVQSLVADGRSAASLAAARFPAPSHWFDRQSPGVGSEILVPAGRGVCPHWPPEQVATRQAFPGSGQVVASEQMGAVGVVGPPQAESPRRSAAASAAVRARRMVSPGGEPRRRR